jgi:hypothetical protein
LLREEWNEKANLEIERQVKQRVQNEVTVLRKDYEQKHAILFARFEQAVNERVEMEVEEKWNVKAKPEIERQVKQRVQYEVTVLRERYKQELATLHARFEEDVKSRVDKASKELITRPGISPKIVPSSEPLLISATGLKSVAIISSTEPDLGSRISRLLERSRAL